jgi:hypothetical protein
MNWISRLTNAFRPARTRVRVRPSTRLRLEQLESRLVPYSVSGNAWPHPNLITLSFVPDGTIVSTSGSNYVPSNLFATFNAKFGSAAAWQNQILKAAQVWAQQTNVNFALVPDDGASAGAGGYQQGDPGHGDIRISGFNFGSSTLAQAFMPPSVNNYSIGGDIDFNTAAAFNIGSTYDLFTVAMHEFGHALALDHTNIVSAAMYGAYSGSKTGLSSDDVAGIRAIYSNGIARSGDSLDTSTSTPNNSFAYAANLNSFIDPNALTALVTNLDVTKSTEADYYTFTAPTNTTGTLTINVQSSGLSLLSPKLTVYAADQTTVLGTAGSAGTYQGATLALTLRNVTAGEQFYVKVAGAETGTGAWQSFNTGAYALTLNFGRGSSPTVPLPNTQTLNGSPMQGGGGQPNQNDTEYRVNATTADVQQTFYQSPQSVAMDANGNYVVTWSSHNQDGSGWGVYAQRYDANGNPLGSEFRVNTTTVGDQMYSTVAMDAAGDFVVTWSSHDPSLLFGTGWNVYARRYDANGNALGGEFRVNTTTLGDQMYSTVAMDAVGNFVVTWSSNGQDGSGWGIYARRYDANGNALGGEFRVNTTTGGDQEYSAVAMNGAGNFVVTWSSYGQDGSGWGVYAQRYDANGNALGGEFRVNTTTLGDQEYSSVAMDPAGDFVVTWSSNGPNATGWDVFGQRYNASGVAQGSEFQVNGTTTGDQMYSTVAMDNTGNFIVTWSGNTQGNATSSNSSGLVGSLVGVVTQTLGLVTQTVGIKPLPALIHDNSGWGTYGQQFTADGGIVGTEFLVNTTTDGNQQDSSVVMNANGQVVVVWSGNGPGDDSGVFAQRYNVGTDNLTPNSTKDDLSVNGDEVASSDQPGVAAVAQGLIQGPTILPAISVAAIDRAVGTNDFRSLAASVLHEGPASASAFFNPTRVPSGGTALAAYASMREAEVVLTTPSASPQVPVAGSLPATDRDAVWLLSVPNDSLSSPAKESLPILERSVEPGSEGKEAHDGVELQATSDASFTDTTWMDVGSDARLNRPSVSEGPSQAEADLLAAVALALVVSPRTDRVEEERRQALTTQS